MTRRISLPRLLIPAAVAALLAACGSSTSSNNPPPAADVRVVSGASTRTFTAYSPDTFSVSLAAGGKVTWRNDDGITHTVTDTTAAALFNKVLGMGDTASVVFHSVGDFPFKCSIHPGMRGLIRVTA